MANFRFRELIEESKRAGKRITQTMLANAAGISQASMWAIVEGKTKAPSPQILLAIAGVFSEALDREITIDDLIEKPAPSRPPDEPQAEPRTIDDKIDDINEQLEGIRQEIAGVRTEISKLNQHGR